MRDPWFYASIGRPATVICGVRLLPYSVGHDYLLCTLGNPLAIGEPADAPDVFDFIAICGRNWQQNREAFAGASRLDGLRFMDRLVRRWHSRMDVKIAVANIRQYVDDYRCVPTHHAPKDKDAAGTLTAAPLHWHLVHVLREHYHMDAPWDCPFNEAKCYFDVWAEANGSDTLDSLSEMQVNELMRQAHECHKVGDIEGEQKRYEQVAIMCNRQRVAEVNAR